MLRALQNFVVAASTLAAAATTGLVLAPVAHAAPACVIDANTGYCYVPPSCSGDSCWGLDPIAARCDNDAVTAGSVRSNQGLLELRYSPSCRANWAKLSNHNPAVPSQFGVKNQEGQAEVWALAGTDSGTYGWTNMVSGVPLAYAWSEGSDGSDYVWTGWH